ncbi:hypothetical protein HJ590_13405 [Naumannella sp. ID2617S]|uniref:Extradiol ring-cleavage dioxygenase LigAB LigA subunit domain-containing protein n=1 Tax=Enemella dayhoffiae TaxID=2016507 RepID=A0A255GL98_9ACTN|nr:hypothetical protein [Enemella dayhoffiae]NNG20544.1 hypothetical protein [Naumannella sp. ID2617S]OYO16590.1 hypothetical protein CGZ93_17670 [Enemella dayhoffiae]
MSRYALQKCLFDHLRRLEDPGDNRAADDLVTDGYDLDPAELAAASGGDVAAFHDLGVHPVLINGYCRANGWKRADYKQLFRAEQVRDAEQTGELRWQNS